MLHHISDVAKLTKVAHALTYLTITGVRLRHCFFPDVKELSLARVFRGAPRVSLTVSVKAIKALVSKVNALHVGGEDSFYVLLVVLHDPVC